MSSTPSSRLLTASDLNVLRKVLTDAGYSSDVLTGTSTGTAAKVLISLFQSGMTDPVELQTELDSRFGRSEQKASFASNTLHPLAIRGLPRSTDTILQ
ncbi:hypothetical protein [Rhizobium sp. S163]|uniref:hypothetical protein n=1 Tax=Rhizobium sp. S163 TaxID=3055039 RepID=UPI0025A9B016|nr:hypothetical protein [Rhizobium sp. S163]MDM9649300.1 hypothetical protein [Rhizobium sp. S163]